MSRSAADRQKVWQKGQQLPGRPVTCKWCHKELFLKPSIFVSNSTFTGDSDADDSVMIDHLFQSREIDTLSSSEVPAVAFMLPMPHCSVGTLMTLADADELIYSLKSTESSWTKCASHPACCHSGSPLCSFSSFYSDDCSFCVFLGCCFCICTYLKHCKYVLLVIPITVFYLKCFKWMPGASHQSQDYCLRLNASVQGSHIESVVIFELISMLLK